MKSKYIGFGILALAIIGIVFVIFISDRVQQGQQSPTCPTCPNPGTWSECSNESIKSRTNYRCGAEINYTCAAYNETKTCATELKLSSAGIEGLVSPTADEIVKGIIKAEATKVPAGTTVVAFIFAPQGTLEGGLNLTDPNVQIVRDTIKEDGWKALFDTAKVKNGLYIVFVGASYEGASDANPWLDQISTQVVVKN